jgi:hypothetical protein
MRRSGARPSRRWRLGRRLSCLGLALAAAVAATRPAPARGAESPGDPFADAVAAYTPGVNGGFGADELPGVVLGPPVGGGATQGSLDVLALGSGGSITLRFDPPVICDGPGVDFTVFENAFHSGTPSGPLFVEYAYVAVSQDGEHFVEFPYDPSSGVGLAGRTPVFSAPDNGISPLDPAVSGGDSFDLADVGLAWATYVRITDVGGAIPDFGDLPQFSVAPNAGADIDAVAAVNACDPSATTPTPTATATPTEPTSASATATPGGASPTSTAPPTPSVAGDLDGDGRVTAADVAWLLAELFDGDGDRAAAAIGGSVPSGPAADVNGDGRITAADLAALRQLVAP